MTWEPAREFVEIQWDVGSKKDGPRERSGGAYSKSGETHKGARYLVNAYWTEISRDNIGAQDTVNFVLVVFVVDGVERCRQKTPPVKNPIPLGSVCVGLVP